MAESLLDLADEVVGIDVDGPAIQRARATTDRRITYVRGDVLTHGFPPGSFDAVVSVAASHHFDLAEGLARMADLVRPGGVVAVVGLAHSPRSMSDLVYDGLGSVVTRVLHRTRNVADVDAPIVWPPPLTHRQSREIAERVLPGVHYRRLVLFRHSLIWTRPS